MEVGDRAMHDHKEVGGRIASGTAIEEAKAEPRVKRDPRNCQALACLAPLMSFPSPGLQLPLLRSDPEEVLQGQSFHHP